MYIQCPKCLYAEDIDKEKIPQGVLKVKCPKCGDRFPLPSSQMSQAKDPPAQVAATVVFEQPIPVRKEKPQPKPSIAAAESAKKQTTGKHKLVFHGSGSTLFGIYAINYLLSIVTLGIYYFWGKTKVRKYLYNQIEIFGERFSYAGTGGEIFKGWLKGLGILFLIFAIPQILSYLSNIYSLTMLSFLLIIPLIPFALISARRYRLSRSSLYGIRFSFRGSFKQGILLYIGGGILTAITLGIYYPFFRAKMMSYYCNSTYFGSSSFKYTGKGRDIFGSFIIAVLLLPFTLGLILLWYKAKLFRYDLEHTTFDGLKFSSTLTGKEFFIFQFLNMLLLNLTFGIAYPWFVARSLRFNFEHINIEGSVDLAAIKQAAGKTGAVGEGLLDQMDMDIGIGL